MYCLGPGREGAGAILTYLDVDGNERSYSARVESPVSFELSEGNRIDISDPTGGNVRDIEPEGSLVDVVRSSNGVNNPFRNMEYEGSQKGVVAPGSPHELPTLCLPLLNGCRLTIAPYI